MRGPAKYQLAGLKALSSTLEIAMRALVASYPELWREPRLDEPPEIRSADALVNLCSLLLAAIDKHRRIITPLVPCDAPSDDPNWPF